MLHTNWWQGICNHNVLHDWQSISLWLKLISMFGEFVMQDLFKKKPYMHFLPLLTEMMQVVESVPWIF